jgi:hypothetical protein
LNRFPIGSSDAPRAQQIHTISLASELVIHESITKLPPELLHNVTSHLLLSDTVALAEVNKSLYQTLLGSAGGRDTLAKAYMHSQALWYLAYGASKLKWWNKRDSDDQLG